MTEQNELQNYDPRLQKPDQPRERGIITEKIIVPQIGTEPEQLANRQYNEMILSNLQPAEIFLSVFAESIPKWAGGKKWQQIMLNYRYLNRSKGGWNQNNIIKVSGNVSGSPQSSDHVDKPGWLGRNISNRSWKKEAAEQGKELPPGDRE